MAQEPVGVEPADIEAIVRKYLARMARRYMPLIGSLLVLVLLAAFVPSRSQMPVTDIQDSGAGSDFGPLPGDGTGAVGGSTGTGGSPGRTPSGGGTTGGGAAVEGITQPPPAGTKGTARSGVECGPDVRQVTWSPYVPLCTPRFTGNNGGETYRGVTKDKIRGFYRMASSAQDAAINAALGEANLDDEKYLADMKTYMEFFNKQFELYGRQFEIVTYNAQGDYLQEHQGLDQGQAQADAQRAVDMNGFIDVTFPLKGSYPFWEALAKRKALTMGPTGFPDPWYASRAPYWYSVLPTGTGVANWLGTITCRRMANMNAVFAGDPLYQNTKRVFGLVHPENPEYTEIARRINDLMAKCGAKPIRTISYTINVAEMGAESASVIAQLKAAGVTTALCYCDPVFPIFVMNSAEGQNYDPEWWSPAWGDSQAQQLPQDQWEHAFVVGAEYPPRSRDQAYQVFKMIKPNAEPASPYYALAYSVMLLLFDALQQTGPNVNPATFQQGWFGLGAISGPAGTLEWKPGHYSPVRSAPAAWWDPSATSNFNGNQGAYRNCDGGKFFPFDLNRAAEYGSGQLGCFKK